MGRFSAVFLLVGLAIGLWLGFEPTMHRQVMQWWDRTSSNRQTASLPTLFNVRPLDQRVNRFLRTTPKPQPAPASKPGTLPTGSQITADIQALFNALHKMWLTLVAKINVPST